MQKRKCLLLIACFTAAFFMWGCPEKNDSPDADTPEEVPYNSDIDNSFIETITDDDTIVVSSIVTDSGVVIADGDTAHERVLTISGTVPDYLGAKRTSEQPERIELSADGGSCLNPGPWNDADTFSTSFQQTVSLSYSHNGVMCTGDWGYTITITNLGTGTVAWKRDVLQGIGADVDQTTGSLDLPAGTYEIHVSTVTGTHTYASLTYTPGSGGVVGSSIVVYHNGNLYPVSEATPGATYSHVVDLVNGDNVIRVLVIGNFERLGSGRFGEHLCDFRADRNLLHYRGHGYSLCSVVAVGRFRCRYVTLSSRAEPSSWKAIAISGMRTRTGATPLRPSTTQCSTTTTHGVTAPKQPFCRFRRTAFIPWLFTTIPTTNQGRRRPRS